MAGLGARHPVYPPEIAALGRRGAGQGAAGWAQPSRPAATASHTLPCGGDTPGDTGDSCPSPCHPGVKDSSFRAGRDAGVPVQSSAETQCSPVGQKPSGHRVVPR